MSLNAINIRISHLVHLQMYQYDNALFTCRREINRVRQKGLAAAYRRKCHINKENTYRERGTKGDNREIRKIQGAFSIRSCLVLNNTYILMLGIRRL